MEEAKKSIKWYRSDYQVEEEFQFIRKFVENSQEQTFGEKLGELKQPAMIRATILIIVLWTFMQICGFNNILFFMENILSDAKVSILKPKIVVIYAGITAVIASIISIVVIDKCGR